MCFRNLESKATLRTRNDASLGWIRLGNKPTGSMSMPLLTVQPDVVQSHGSGERLLRNLTSVETRISTANV